MPKKKRTVSYSARELERLVKREGSRSNWEKALRLTKRQVENLAVSDPDEKAMVIDWDRAAVAMPEPKAVLNMRVDRDVLDYFRRQGNGYQTKINAVLRSYVEYASRKRA